MKKQRLRSRKLRLTAVETRCADHATPSIRKSRHYFADSGGRWVCVVRLRTKATEFSLSVGVTPSLGGTSVNAL
jgi:hypothetical protein